MAFNINVADLKDGMPFMNDFRHPEKVRQAALEQVLDELADLVSNVPVANGVQTVPSGTELLAMARQMGASPAEVVATVQAEVENVVAKVEAVNSSAIDQKDLTAQKTLLDELQLGFEPRPVILAKAAEAAEKEQEAVEHQELRLLEDDNSSSRAFLSQKGQDGPQSSGHGRSSHPDVDESMMPGFGPSGS
jgi:hypothetical protein